MKYSQIKIIAEQKELETSNLLIKYQEISDKYKNLEINSSDLKRERDILDNKFRNISESLAFSDTDRLDMSGKIAKYENEIKVLKSQLQNLKNNSSENEEKKISEISLLKKETDALKIKDRELINKVKRKKKTFDFLKKNKKKLKSNKNQFY